jgi:hypothetical protein
MGDFLAELFDQLDQEEQARIEAAESLARKVLQRGADAVKHRRRASGSPDDSDWVLQPERDARADSAGVVFVAYANAFWRKTDAARDERIQDFLAKVEKLIDPILARFGREGKGLIDVLRWQCQFNIRYLPVLLRTGTASATPSAADSAAGSPQDGTEYASGPTEISGAAERSETKVGESSDVDSTVLDFQLPEILQFSSSWCERKRQNADLRMRGITTETLLELEGRSSYLKMLVSGRRRH